jgi:hypothetical protein
MLGVWRNDLETMDLREAVKPMTNFVRSATLGLDLTDASTCAEQGAGGVGGDVAGYGELDRFSFFVHDVELGELV